MGEILEDLRKRADSAREAQHHYDHNPVMTDEDIVAFCEAADTIEALQQRCDELKATSGKLFEECGGYINRIAALEAALKDLEKLCDTGYWPKDRVSAGVWIRKLLTGSYLSGQALTSSEGAGECICKAGHHPDQYCPIHSPTSAAEGRGDG